MGRQRDTETQRERQRERGRERERERERGGESMFGGKGPSVRVKVVCPWVKSKEEAAVLVLAQSKGELYLLRHSGNLSL